MQILENSILGLRAARLHYVNNQLSISVSLFPMVHFGEAEFFQTVYEDAFNHDVVLVEGVRSPVVKCLTASYRWIDNASLGLVIQPKYPAAETVNAKIIHADLSMEEFNAEWRKVPLWLRASVLLISPILGLKRRIFASRTSIFEGMSMEDLESRDEILSWDPTHAALDHCILGARDARILEKLRAQIAQPNLKDRRIAVVYGALHMRAVLGELKRQNFVLMESRLQTVHAL